MSHTTEPMFEYKFNQLARYENGRTPVLLTEAQYKRASACVRACKRIGTDILEAVAECGGISHQPIETISDLQKQVEGLQLAETNLRQQVAHLTDQLAGEKSNVELANRKCDELLTALDLANKDATRWKQIELLMFLGSVELNHEEDGGYGILLEPAENIMSQHWTGNSPEEVIDSIDKATVKKCKTCNGEGGWEAAASSTSYFWKDCPDCASMKGGAS